MGIESHFAVNPKFEGAEALLPAWFVRRMMGDCWYFGLLLTNGKTIGIQSIADVKKDDAGNIWLDVFLLPMEYGKGLTKQDWIDLVCAPTSRADASINAAHVVMAFELADT